MLAKSERDYVKNRSKLTNSHKSTLRKRIGRKLDLAISDINLILENIDYFELSKSKSNEVKLAWSRFREGLENIKTKNLDNIQVDNPLRLREGFAKDKIIELCNLFGIRVEKNQ